MMIIAIGIKFSTIIDKKIHKTLLIIITFDLFLLDFLYRDVVKIGIYVFEVNKSKVNTRRIEHYYQVNIHIGTYSILNVKDDI